MTHRASWTQAGRAHRKPRPESPDATDGGPQETSTRSGLLVRLLRNDPLTPAERRCLGPFVTRDELAHTIERELAARQVFPPEARGRTHLRVSDAGIHLVHRRMNRKRTLEPCASIRHAVERFLDIEIGPSCGGVPVRGKRPLPATRGLGPTKP